MLSGKVWKFVKRFDFASCLVARLCFIFFGCCFVKFVVVAVVVIALNESVGFCAFVIVIFSSRSSHVSKTGSFIQLVSSS